MNVRAITPEAKRAIIKRLEVAWLANPHMRLGQLLESAAGESLYYLEDEELARELEAWCKQVRYDPP